MEKDNMLCWNLTIFYYAQCYHCSIIPITCKVIQEIVVHSVCVNYTQYATTPGNSFCLFMGYNKLLNL
jgi:hypothetical protein